MLMIKILNSVVDFDSWWKLFFLKREKTVNPGQVLGSTWFNLCIVFSMDYIFITLLIKLKILANLIKCIISE